MNYQEKEDNANEQNGSSSVIQKAQEAADDCLDVLISMAKGTIEADSGRRLAAKEVIDIALDRGDETNVSMYSQLMSRMDALPKENIRAAAGSFDAEDCMQFLDVAAEEELTLSEIRDKLPFQFRKSRAIAEYLCDADRLEKKKVQRTYDSGKKLTVTILSPLPLSKDGLSELSAVPGSLEKLDEEDERSPRQVVHIDNM